MPARTNIAIDRQRAIPDIRRKMGKNAMLRRMNLLEGAMAKERNRQVGGHGE